MTQGWFAKRGLKGVPSVAIKTPEDLPAAFDLIDQAASTEETTR